MSDSTMSVRLSFNDANGKTCNVCGQYRKNDQFLTNETGDDWFDAFLPCLDCSESANTWSLELTLLEDNDGATTLWERDERDGPEAVNRLLARTRDGEILERHDAPWRVDVRFNGWAPGRFRKPNAELDTYFLTARKAGSAA